MISHIEVPTEMLRDPSLSLWRSWSPETNGTIGSIKTAAFAPPRYIAIPFHGFPGEYFGSRIFLRCISSDAEIEVAIARTNTQWAMAHLKLPETFCTSDVELVATNANTRSYVGLGTPFSIDILFYLAHTTVFPTLFVVMTTWGLFYAFGFTAIYLTHSRLKAPATTTSFIAVGVVAMLTFSVFCISPQIGSLIVWLLIFGATGILLVAYLRDHRRLLSIGRYTGRTATLWLIVSLSYASLSVAADNGGGSWAINHLFTPLRWSFDNQIPFLFSEAMFGGTSREHIAWGPWLASDRPPLLTAMLLVARSTFISLFSRGTGSDFIPLAYQSVAITLLSTWSVVIYHFGLRWGHRHASYIVVIAFLTSFFLFNTIYIWPKILGAVYVVIVFDILLRTRSGSTSGVAALVMIALAVALAYLSHGSNAFVLLPLAIVFLPTIFRCGAHSILVATLAGLTCISPWLWWQSFVQPHGNALIRFALANDFGFNDRASPISASMGLAYWALGWEGWLKLKLSGLRMLLGLQTDWKSFGEVVLRTQAEGTVGPWRVLDFFSLARSLGITFVGLILLVINFGSRNSARKGTAPVIAATVIGFGGIALSWIVVLPPPITHQQAYGAILLLFIAGALTLSQSGSVIRYSAFAVTLLYWLLVWIADPLLNALRVDVFAMVTFLAGSTWVVLLWPQCNSTATTNNSFESRCRLTSSGFFG